MGENSVNIYRADDGYQVMSERELSDDELEKTLNTYFSGQKEYPDRFIPGINPIPLEKGGAIVIPPRFSEDPQAHLRAGFEKYIKSPGQALGGSLDQSTSNVEPGQGWRSLVGKALKFGTQDPGTFGSIVGGAVTGNPLGATAGGFIGRTLLDPSVSATPEGTERLKEAGVQAFWDQSLGFALKLGLGGLSEKFASAQSLRHEAVLRENFDKLVKETGLPNISSAEVFKNPEKFLSQLDTLNSRTARQLFSLDVPELVKNFPGYYDKYALNQLSDRLVKLNNLSQDLVKIDRFASPSSYESVKQSIVKQIDDIYTIASHGEKLTPRLNLRIDAAVNQINYTKQSIEKALSAYDDITARRYVLGEIVKGKNPQAAMKTGMEELARRKQDIAALAEDIYQDKVKLVSSKEYAQDEARNLLESAGTDIKKSRDPRFKALGSGLTYVGEKGKEIRQLSKPLPFPHLSAPAINPGAVSLIKDFLGLHSSETK